MTNTKYSYHNRTYILHSYPHKESSLIINAFTFEQGRIDLLAKGVKKSKKGLHSILQPFQPISISFLIKDNLSILTTAELNNVTVPILNGKSMYCAYYLNELLLRLLPVAEPVEEIFYLYDETLNQLHEVGNLESNLRRFEVLLLEYLGYQLNLEFDTLSNQLIQTDKDYFYDINMGPFEISSESKPRDKINTHIKISGKALRAINTLDFSDKNVVKESKNLLRLVLQQYLGSKPLKSRALFKQLYGNGKDD